MDIGKQVNFWRQGAGEDWQVACELVDAGRVRHGLFFAHLALEKLLKAHVCHRTQDLAPRVHNLVRLAELAGLSPDTKQLDVLAEMNEFCIEGRYPSMVAPPSPAEARAYMARAKEVREWLVRLF